MAWGPRVAAQHWSPRARAERGATFVFAPASGKLWLFGLELVAAVGGARAARVGQVVTPAPAGLRPQLRSVAGVHAL